METCDVPAADSVSVTLPTESVTQDILPKLPAKSLVRFKCVSKLFNTLISSPEFIDFHLRQSDANRLLILVGNDGTKLYSFDIDSQDPSPAVKIPLPPTLAEWSYKVSCIIGSLNGLLCVCAERTSGEYMLVLINPCTGVYREMVIPVISIESSNMMVSFGFGYDDTKHDYKLVAVVDYFDNNCEYPGDELICSEVMVCSLNKNQWQLVDRRNRPTDMVKSGKNGVFMKNHLHWLFWGLEYKFRICCFDVGSEKWVKDVPLMDLFTCLEAGLYDKEYRDKLDFVHKLGVVDGCLCLSTSTRSYAVIVWIMREYGVKESWVKLFEIPKSCIPSGICFFHDPFSFRQGSKHRQVLGTDYSQVEWCNCDIESHSFGNTEIIKGVPNFRSLCFLKESLVPIPGGHHIEAA